MMYICTSLYKQSLKSVLFCLIKALKVLMKVLRDGACRMLVVVVCEGVVEVNFGMAFKIVIAIQYWLFHGPVFVMHGYYKQEIAASGECSPHAYCL